ncbi:MAG: ABC transporter ATP-binding protein [Sulfolobales archaeon]
MISLRIEKLSVKLGGQIILRNIDLELREGIYLLTGRNGSGKTTLMKTIAGLIKNYEGEIYVNNKNLRDLSRKEIASLIGYVWQNPYHGFIEARVIDEIMLIKKILKLDKYDKELMEALVDPLLLERDPFTLSGGEAKRVSIASILIADQPIWLLDEPFDYLDLHSTQKLSQIISSKRDRKIVVISTTHLCFLNFIDPDTIILLDRGEISFVGNVKELKDEVLDKTGVIGRREICG